MKQKPVDILRCPVCDNASIIPRIKAKDHYYSQQEFNISVCSKCDLGITTPRPSDETISEYYDSANYISHGKFKPSFRDNLYRLVKLFNNSYKFRKLIDIVPRGTWCDYGAGDGSFVAYIKSRSTPIIGFEPDENARQNAQKKGLHLQPLSEFTTVPTAFACITLWHVLEHIPNLNDVIVRLQSKLTSGGAIVIAVPNSASKDAEHYGSYWAALDVPRHLWHFSPKNLEHIFNKHGMHKVKSFGLPYDAFYISNLSERYKTGNPLLGILHGLSSNLSAKFGTRTHSSIVMVFTKNAF